MKKIFTLCAMLTIAISTFAQSKSFEFTPIKTNAITSIKNQNRSGTCWAYSGLGFFESELLRMGKGEYNLCEMYVAHKTYEDRGRASVRLHGDISFSQGGSFYDVVYCMKNYGMMPEEAMPLPGTLYGDTLANFTEFFKSAEGYINGIAKGEQKKLSPAWFKGFNSILDTYLGEVPEEFEYEGVTYTPKSFMDHLGLNMDDYISLTSYTHHPFYEPFILEIQDNWRWGTSYNLPIDELMEVMNYAVKNGYTFAWGSDVSESGFTRNGIAVCPDVESTPDLTGSDMAHWLGLTSSGRMQEALTRPYPELTITQEMRQEAYDNWETTDDHGMLVYGLAKDQTGKEYFIVKNSWGPSGKYAGTWYASQAFVAYKTMNILVHKDGIPKNILKKLKIK